MSKIEYTSEEQQVGERNRSDDAQKTKAVVDRELATQESTEEIKQHAQPSTAVEEIRKGRQFKSSI